MRRDELAQEVMVLARSYLDDVDEMDAYLEEIMRDERYSAEEIEYTQSGLNAARFLGNLFLELAERIRVVEP